MRCPLCNFESTRVVDSRLAAAGEAIRRRRECMGCGTRFTTHERIEELPVEVLKRDGSRERFDRRKLLRGLVRAAGGRSVGGEQLEALADSIATQVRRGGGEVRAERIGDLAERGLARLDPVTAIQFASVYRRIADLDELESVVRRLRDEPVPGTDQMALAGPADPSETRTNIGRSPAGGTPPTEEPRREHVRPS